MTDYPQLWTQPEWLATAHAWIEQAVRGAGSRLTGKIEQPRVRPWATVLHAPTNDGMYYFKASMPRLAFEAALTLALRRYHPDVLPEVVAADPERGWMLTRDAGTPLRQAIHSPVDVARLAGILPRLAEIQQEWLGREQELLALGVFDRRVEVLPDKFERLAGERECLMVGRARGLNEEQYAHLLSTTSCYRAFCTRLMEYPIANSIHYDDMHTGNLFLRENEFGQVRLTFSDWGDSAVGHPFFSLIIFLRQLGEAIGLPDEATDTPESLPPVLQRVRDMYLEPWQTNTSQADLVAAFNLAWRVGMVGRALTWQEVIAAMGEAYRPEYAYYVPAWLGEFLLTMDGYTDR